MDWRRLIGPNRSQNSTGLGSDVPESAGDRERGKFRESQYPRLSTVAVVDDHGEPIGYVLMPSFADLATEIRRLRLALTVSGIAADLGDDLE